MAKAKPKKKSRWTAEEKRKCVWLAPYRTPWKPGQSGNPKGRPRKRPITTRYEEALELPIPETIRKKFKLKKGAVLGDAVAMNIVGQAAFAVKGAVEAAREVREATEGKVGTQSSVNWLGDVKMVVVRKDRLRIQDDVVLTGELAE